MSLFLQQRFFSIVCASSSSASQFISRVAFFLIFLIQHWQRPFYIFFAVGWCSESCPFCAAAASHVGSSCCWAWVELLNSILLLRMLTNLLLELLLLSFYRCCCCRCCCHRIDSFDRNKIDDEEISRFFLHSFETFFLSYSFHFIEVSYHFPWNFFSIVLVLSCFVIFSFIGIVVVRSFESMEEYKKKLRRCCLLFDFDDTLIHSNQKRRSTTYLHTRQHPATADHGEESTQFLISLALWFAFFLSFFFHFS